MSTKKAVVASAGTMTFGSWVKTYRAAAKLDGYRKLAARLEEIGYEADVAPEVFKDTVRRVALVCAFYGVDGREGLSDFLRLQTYDITASGAKYLLRLELCEASFLLVNDMGQVDLVDLFNAPPGFIHLYIDHVNEEQFTPDELVLLEGAIRDDFYYDFEPDEIILEIDSNENGIVVNVCEADETPPW